MLEEKNAYLPERSDKNMRAVLVFFGLVFALTWIVPTVLLLISVENYFQIPGINALSSLFGFGPSLAGLLSAMIYEGKDGVKRLIGALLNWRVAPGWYLFAIFLPIAAAFTALILHLLTGESDVSGVQWGGLSMLWQFIYLVFVAGSLLGSGMGEELGWRGFALPRLQVQIGAFKASIIIGVVWTVWHLPIHLVMGSVIINFVSQLFFTVGLSFIFTWLYNRVNGRLLPVVLLHGAINGFNAFFKQSLFPPLAYEGRYKFLWIAIIFLIGAEFAVYLRRKDRTLIK